MMPYNARERRRNAGTYAAGMTSAIDIALLSPESFAQGQPHEQFAWLRANDPVQLARRTRREWVLGGDPLPRCEDDRSRRRDLLVDAGDHDPGRRGGIEVGDHRMMITTDPPEHTGLRKLVAGEFIPRAAKAMRPRTRVAGEAHHRRVIDKGECDLVEDIAGLMPSYVIADMLGIPHEDGVACTG